MTPQPPALPDRASYVIGSFSCIPPLSGESFILHPSSFILFLPIIPLWRLVTIESTMPLFLAQIGDYGQSIRAGQGGPITEREPRASRRGQPPNSVPCRTPAAGSNPTAPVPARAPSRKSCLRTRAGAGVHSALMRRAVAPLKRKFAWHRIGQACHFSAARRVFHPSSFIPHPLTRPEARGRSSGVSPQATCCSLDRRPATRHGAAAPCGLRRYGIDPDRKEGP